MRGARLSAFLSASFRHGWSVYWTLLRITLPLLLVVRVLDEQFNIIAHSGDLLAPLMAVVGLPGDTAIIFATALFVQVYAAALVLLALWTQLELTTAQVTVLMTMILVAHALPVEGRIVQKAGMPATYAVLLRLGGAFVMGGLLNIIYGDTYLQTAAALPFAPPQADDSWGGWVIEQLRNWSAIFIIVQALVLFVNLMRVTHAERLLIYLLSPLLRLLGIGEKAVTMAMIGILLGLSYGGGLLIEESRKGSMERSDVLCTLSLLCLCHSVIDDTLLALLLGAHISGVLYARVIFSFIFMVLLSLVLRGNRALARAD